MAYSIPAALFSIGCFYVFGSREHLHGATPSERTFLGVIPMLTSTNVTIRLLRSASLKGRFREFREAAQGLSRARLRRISDGSAAKARWRIPKLSSARHLSAVPPVVTLRIRVAHYACPTPCEREKFCSERRCVTSASTWGLDAANLMLRGEMDHTTTPPVANPSPHRLNQSRARTASRAADDERSGQTRPPGRAASTVTGSTVRGTAPPDRSKDLDALTTRLNALAITDLWQRDVNSLDPGIADPRVVPDLRDRR